MDKGRNQSRKSKWLWFTAFAILVALLVIAGLITHAHYTTSNILPGI